MGRSVVTAGTIRCEQCCLPPRWCICSALPPVVAQLQVDILMHPREQFRPTSTGRLIGRVFQGSRIHRFERGVAPQKEPILRPNRHLWVLHPRGEPLEKLTQATNDRPDPNKVQVLLLDGSWNEVNQLLRFMGSWGRQISLTSSEASRFRLRQQDAPGRMSTAEALICVLDGIGEPEIAQQMRLHMELHVYATLRARGRRAEAEQHLKTSPIRHVLREFLETLTTPRPNLDPPRVRPAPGAFEQ